MEPKNVPSKPVQLYHVEEFGKGFTKINETLDKIKNELQIDSFLSLANYLEIVLENIVKEKDIANKTLIFMEGLTKLPHV